MSLALLFFCLFSLLPGDAVVIKFRQPTALSKSDVGHYTYTVQDTVFVEGDTTVFIPFVGRLKVGNLDGQELQDSVYRLYSNYFLRPVYNISVLYRIYIVGEVKRPGEYYVDFYNDIWDAIGKSGGVTSSGDIKRVRIIRQGKEMKIDVWDAMKQRKSLEEIGVRSGDIIEVPKKRTAILKEVLDIVWKIVLIWAALR